MALSPKPLDRRETDITVLPVGLLPVYSGKGTVRNDDPLPVIAYGEEKFLRKAFLSGVFDYLKDPWGPEELIIRLERLLSKWNSHLQFHWGDLIFRNDLVCLGDRRVRLSSQESDILRLLLKKRGHPVSREVLYYVLWGKHPDNKPSRVVDVHIASIRKKIRTLRIPVRKPEKPPRDAGFIASIRGLGYMIRDNPPSVRRLKRV